MTEGPASSAGLGRLARAVGHGPDFQILIVEAVADEATRMAREAIDHAAEERGLRVAEVCWDPAADAEGLERLIVAAASEADLINLSGAPDWLTSERWQGLNIRRDRLAESARARLVWWLHPRNVAEMATQAPDLWAWRGGVYSFLDVASPCASPLTSFDFPTRPESTGPTQSHAARGFARFGRGSKAPPSQSWSTRWRGSGETWHSASASSTRPAMHTGTSPCPPPDCTTRRRMCSP